MSYHPSEHIAKKCSCLIELDVSYTKENKDIIVDSDGAIVDLSLVAFIHSLNYQNVFS